MAIVAQWSLGENGGYVRDVGVSCDICGAEILYPDDGAVVLPMAPGDEEASRPTHAHMDKCLDEYLLLAWIDPESAVIQRLTEHLDDLREFGVSHAV